MKQCRLCWSARTLTVKAYDRTKEILKDLFGSKCQVTRATINECTNGPAIRGYEVQALRKLIVAMTKAEITVAENGESGELTSTTQLVKIYQRLPRHLQFKWNDKVVEIQDRN